LASEMNRGFTGGMNLGLAHAAGRWVFLTEDDVILEPDCLARLVEYAERDPPAGLVSGIMVDAESGTILSAGGSIRLEGVYRQEIVARGEKNHGQFAAPYDVSYIPGAMMFARRDVWQALGGFRDDFFVYYEDAELCFRASRAGYRITIVPAA